jgi:hypothetical protein
MLRQGWSGAWLTGVQSSTDKRNKVHIRLIRRYELRLDNIASNRNEKENNPSLRFTFPLRFGGSAFSANQKLNI